MARHVHHAMAPVKFLLPASHAMDVGVLNAINAMEVLSAKTAQVPDKDDQWISILLHREVKS